MSSQGDLTNKRTNSNAVPTSESNLDISMESLLKEAKGMGGTSLWDELQQEEDGEKSWFEKFGDKVKDVSDDIVNKVKDAKIHFAQLGFFVDDRNNMHGKTDGKGMSQTIGAKSNAKSDPTEKLQFHVTALSLLSKRLQALAYGHGNALELLRELFLKVDTKLEDLAQKMENIPTTQYMDNTIHEQIKVEKVESDKKIKDLEDNMNQIKLESAKVKQENTDLKNDIDEARQRGIKGNIIVSCPADKNGISAASQLVERGVKESPQEMISRLILKKTGCHIPPSEMMACHTLAGEKNKNTWIIRVANRAPDSGWEALATGMLTGKRTDKTYFEKNDGIYLNFQLTDARNKVLHQVRMARKMEKISKFSVNQNGQIKVLVAKSPRTQVGNHLAKEPWRTIQSLDDLRELLPGQVFPVPQQRQQQQGSATMIGSLHNTPRH